MTITKKILTAAIVAALAFAGFATAGAAGTTTSYVFRMPMPGLQGSAAGEVAGAGGAVCDWTTGALPGTGQGSEAIPAGCISITFALEGTAYYTGTDGYWIDGDDVDGQYALPSSGGATVAYNWQPDGSVALYVDGVQIALAAAAGSGAQSRVMNGAIATKITVAGPVPAGGWAPVNSGWLAVDAH